MNSLCRQTEHFMIWKWLWEMVSLLTAELHLKLFECEHVSRLQAPCWSNPAVAYHTNRAVFNNCSDALCWFAWLPKHKQTDRHSHISSLNMALYDLSKVVLMMSESIMLQQLWSTKTTTDPISRQLCMWSDLCPGWNSRPQIQCHCGSAGNKQKALKPTSRNSLLSHRIWTTCPSCVLLPDTHTPTAHCICLHHHN